MPAVDHIGKTVREVLGGAAAVIESGVQRVFATGAAVTHHEVSVLLPTRTEAGHWIEHYFPIKDDEAGKCEANRGRWWSRLPNKRSWNNLLQDVGGKLGKQSERLQMLLDVSTILASNWNLQQVFPRISARIRRVLRQEYAGFELHDTNTGLLVRQAEDFPLGKGCFPALPISPHNSPGGRALRGGHPSDFLQETDAGL